MVIRLFLGLILACAAAFVAAVTARARRLRRTEAAIGKDILDPPGGGMPIVRARARHEATWFGKGESRVFLARYPRETFGELTLTSSDFLLALDVGGTIQIPIARMLAPALLPGFGTLAAETVGGLLRVDWVRGGVRLSSVFAIDGTRQDAERIRRELHLRTGPIAHIPIAAPFDTPPTRR